MSQHLSDIEYIRMYNDAIGAQYEEAKNLYLVAPIQTLVDLRAIISDICINIAEEQEIDIGNADLFDSIKKLKSSRILHSEIISLLHEIRISGNKAAHQEAFKLTKEQYAPLVLKTLNQFCELIQSIKLTLLGQP